MGGKFLRNLRRTLRQKRELAAIRSLQALAALDSRGSGLALAPRTPKEETSFDSSDLSPGPKVAKVDQAESDFWFVTQSDSVHVLSLLAGEQFDLERLSLHDSLVLEP